MQKKTKANCKETSWAIAHKKKACNTLQLARTTLNESLAEISFEYLSCK
jgi:hypothetical protein